MIVIPGKVLQEIAQRRPSFVKIASHDEEFTGQSMPETAMAWGDDWHLWFTQAEMYATAIKRTKTPCKGVAVFVRLNAGLIVHLYKGEEEPWWKGA